MRHRPRGGKRRESQVPFSQGPAQAGGDMALLDHFNICHERPRATHCIDGPGLLPGCRRCKAKQGAKRRFTHDRGLPSPVGTCPAGRRGIDLTIHFGSDQGFMLRYLFRPACHLRWLFVLQPVHPFPYALLFQHRQTRRVRRRRKAAREKGSAIRPFAPRPAARAPEPVTKLPL